MSYPYGSAGRAASTPDFIAADGKVENLGKQIGGHAPSVGSLAEKTGAIQTEFPHFGVVGLRTNLAHGEARAGAVRALNAGKAVLESWKDALTQTEKNYQASDKNATMTVEQKTEHDGGKNDEKGLGGGADQAGLNGSGPSGIPPFPTSNVDTPPFPDSNLDTSKFPDSNLDTPKFPDSDVDTPKFPDPNLKTPELQDPNTKTPQMPGMPKPDDLANGPGSNLPGVDRNAIEDSLSNKNGAGLGDRDLGLPDPRQTDLSASNPSNLPNTPNALDLPNVPTPQSNIPDLRSSPGDQAGADMSTRAGGSLGGSSGAGGPALTRAAGVNGMNGMPFMPPMMGGGGPPGGEQQNKDGSNIALSEDESVWDGDEDISPAVLGREA